MTISAVIVTLILAHVIPILTALVTKSAASAGVKQVVTAVFAAVGGLLTTATTLDGTAVLSRESLLLGLGAFVTTQATYRGLFRPNQLNQKVAPEAGLG